jgi:hypothetical protein
MKKCIFLLASMAMIILASCESTPDSTRTAPSYEFRTEIVPENNNDLAKIFAKAEWETTGRFRYLGLSGFSVDITNNTDKVIRVIWEKSSVSYSGSSYTPFLDGQKFINASEPMAPTTIPARGVVSKTIYSSGQPRYNDGWEMIPLAPAGTFVIVLCVESGDVENNYTITFQYP